MLLCALHPGKTVILKLIKNKINKQCPINIHIQGVPLILVQTLRGSRRHEDKHYSVGFHGAQTSSVGGRGHSSLRSKISNDD